MQRPLSPAADMPAAMAWSALCQQATYAAQQRKLYSITSSARASSDGGISRPMAFAVLRLIVSSNFVGCSIGRSAGLAPCKIRLAYQAPRLNKSDRDVPYE